MANEEHLAVLRQGVEAWNEWRQGNSTILPDLSKADLKGANLSGSNLSKADLFRANLFKANLSGADLCEADLRLANLSGVNLGGAKLSGAHLFRADLSWAKLSGADLSKTNLSEADLSLADLSRADLSEADLRLANLNRAGLNWANLSGVNLSGANLSKAGLNWTNLSKAMLIGANLSLAGLGEADLGGANLSKADLWQAELGKAHAGGMILGYTRFGDNDLSVVEGLETVRHSGPSYIDIHTIFRSKGKIPKAFLRGCGVLDTLITYILSPTDQAWQYCSCFLSYSNRDQDFAERLHADLQDNGIRCWFAPEDLKVGDKFLTRTDETIYFYDKLLLILSEHSINSDWVEREVGTALEKERQQKRKVLFPVRLDEAIWRTYQAWATDIRRTRHIGDFTGWNNHHVFQKGFAQLLHDLQADSPEATE